MSDKIPALLVSVIRSGCGDFEFKINLNNTCNGQLLAANIISTTIPTDDTEDFQKLQSCTLELVDKVFDTQESSYFWWGSYLVSLALVDY